MVFCCDCELRLRFGLAVWDCELGVCFGSVIWECVSGVRCVNELGAARVFLGGAGRHGAPGPFCEDEHAGKS